MSGQNSAVRPLRGDALMRKRIRIFAILALVIAATLIIKSNFHDQREFEWYTRHFHYVKTGEDAIRVYGTPKGTEYSYSSDRQGKSYISYITLYYDGFSFGILGSDETRHICKIAIDKPGLLPLRYRIDIGSPRYAVELAYFDAPKSTEGDAYYLKHRNEISWEGIWIFPVYDENNVLVQFDVTDGL